MDDEEKVEALEKELEELRPLKDTNAKLQEEFKAKEEAWEAEKAKLSEEANPNWAAARKRMAALEEAAKAKGVKLDEEGNPVDETKLNRDELLKEAAAQASAATKAEMLNARIDEELANYDPEEAKVVKHFYDKLAAGEEVSVGKVRSLIQQAAAAAGLGSSAPAHPSIQGGRGPRQVKETPVLDDAQAEAIGAMMGISVTPKKK